MQTTENNNLFKIFNVLFETLSEIREKTRELIESSDLDGDDEVRIFAENFLDIMSPYIKQAEEWLNASQSLTAAEFNIHIQDYTHFIR